MGELIVWELQYVSVVITTGVFLAFCYDIIRIIRRIFLHKVFWLSVEDILFWMGAGVITFVVCFVENAGNIRWFSLAGEILGAYMYCHTVSNFMVKWVSFILKFPINVMKKALKKIIKSFKIENTAT